MDEHWSACVVALGTNLGNREEEAFGALADIRATEGFRVGAVSSLYETVALGPEGPDPSAPKYLNQIILVSSAWSAEKTLEMLLSIENRHGRVRGDQQYADRTLDLDLIVYGEEVHSSEHLSVPHPRAHLRRFVLEPWLEVDAQASIPGRGAVAQLLADLPTEAP
jgi:2-amino-4-hydroxy-6-hydroxymethyldihydropteridine diphosphokinase